MALHALTPACMLCLLSAANFVFVLAVVTDPEDPRFDLEKLIAKWETS